MTNDLSANRKILSTHLLTHGSVASLWFSPHHHQQKSHLFIIPWKKSKLSLSVWLSICLYNSLVGCLKLLIGFPLSVFGHHSRVPASLPDHSENHLIQVDSSLVVPLGIWLSLATTHVVQPPRLTTMRTISSRWT
jgi:hypothetical protein